MILTTIRTETGTSAARVAGEGDDAIVTVLPFRDVGALLEADALSDAATICGEEIGPIAEVDLAAVVTRPSKILCVAYNYRSHIESMGREMPQFPYVFCKYADGLLGPRDELVLPHASDQVDWEGEVGVIIGSSLREASRAEAQQGIAGYTLLNDVSMRDWQAHSSQWTMGKIFDASTPLGPVMVTPDELPHTEGRVDIRLTCDIDGTVVQDARTIDLVFDVADLLSYLSSVLTLRAGDVVATGTPGGVGSSRKPPVFLQAGQTVTVRGDGIGLCANKCVPARSKSRLHEHV